MPSYSDICSVAHYYNCTAVVRYIKSPNEFLHFLPVQRVQGPE